MMPTDSSLNQRYDTAARIWPDKMRALGYYDAYLGMVSHWPRKEDGTQSLVDIGAGSAAMSEAWIAVHGPVERMTLLDPSQQMLERGAEALERRRTSPTCVAKGLAPGVVVPHDVALAAHVIEHFEDAAEALRQIATLVRPGGELWLVVSKPHWCNAIIWLQWRHRSYSEADIARYLDEAGFDLRDTYKFPSGPPSRTSRGYVAIRRAD